MTNSPDDRNGRTIFHWHGQDRKAAIAALADTIVAAVDGLCNHDGSIARLDGKGGLSPVNFATFRQLIDKNVAAVRVVNCEGVWRKEYYAFAFDPPPGPDMQFGGRRPPPNPNEPDLPVLDALYRHEVVARLPRVVG
jgi:hypothetical protein